METITLLIEGFPFIFGVLCLILAACRVPYVLVIAVIGLTAMYFSWTLLPFVVQLIFVSAILILLGWLVVKRVIE